MSRARDFLRGEEKDGSKSGARSAVIDDVSQLLWRDTSVFGARGAKAAAALAAIRIVLERHRRLAGEEAGFLRLHGALDDCGREARDAVWTDPYAYFWVRIAYELLGATMGSMTLAPLARRYCDDLGLDDPRSGLVRHLADFQRLVLGAALLAHRQCVFEPPLAVALPFAVPGTRWSLDGTGTASISGYASGRLQVEHDGVPVSLSLHDPPDTAAPVRLQHCALLAYGGCRVRLQPSVYNLPGLNFGRYVVAAGAAYQEEHAGLAEAALALIERHAPEVFRQFREFVRVVALKPRTPDSPRKDNVSHSDLPGAIVANPTRQAHYLADVFIHELHHNRLFCIEDRQALVADAAIPLDAAPPHYSPWQSDGRPVHAILHAVYVFLPVTRFWLHVYAAGDAEAPALDLALDRIVRGHLQVQIAAHQVRGHARLTAFGEQVVAQLEREVAALGAAIREAGLPADAPAMECSEAGAVTGTPTGNGGSVSIRQTLRAHLEGSEFRDEVADVLRHVHLDAAR